MEFEIYTYRVVIAALAAIVATMILQRWLRQDKVEERLTDAISNVETNMAAMVEKLTQAVNSLEKLIAKEYAPRTELKEAKAEFRRELDKCAENCPFRNAL